jgi:hypothetical protein
MIAGTFMLLSAGAHAILGWEAQRESLGVLGTPADQVARLSAGWHFGSVAMAAFGIAMLICGFRLKRRDYSGIAMVRIVAAAYVIYGVAAYITFDYEPSFLGFVALGALAGLPVMGQSYVRRA